MAEKKSTNRADAVELVDMALGDLKKVAGQLGIENASTLKKAELVQSIGDLQAANREAAKNEREARRMERQNNRNNKNNNAVNIAKCSRTGAVGVKCQLQCLGAGSRNVGVALRGAIQTLRTIKRYFCRHSSLVGFNKSLCKFGFVAHIGCNNIAQAVNIFVQSAHLRVQSRNHFITSISKAAPLALLYFGLLI